MDSKKIEELLNKYWNCESSLEEERQLKEYFRGSQIPEQLTETANLFRYFEENKKKTIVDGAFDGQVMARVKSPGRGKTAILVRNSMRIAAGIAVLMVAFWFVKTEVRKSTPQEIVDTYNDPELAFAETKKALMIISKGFGQAEQQTKKINLFNEAQEEIQKKSTNKKNL
ncbi:MAG TPA: hypothetical protein VEB86_12750 [Chryseosolibacter sp.]|nr:hypothetical protein [Chryseosolibacter sp.]